MVSNKRDHRDSLALAKSASAVQTGTAFFMSQFHVTIESLNNIFLAGWSVWSTSDIEFNKSLSRYLFATKSLSPTPTLNNSHLGLQPTSKPHLSPITTAPAISCLLTPSCHFNHPNRFIDYSNLRPSRQLQLLTSAQPLFSFYFQHNRIHLQDQYGFSMQSFDQTRHIKLEPSTTVSLMLSNH